MLKEYTCLNCEVEEYDFSIIPKKECPVCSMLMNCEEELFDK